MQAIAEHRIGNKTFAEILFQRRVGGLEALRRHIMNADAAAEETRTWVAARETWFEILPNGRVRCRLNGSEFVPRLDVLNAFFNGKKFQRLRELDAALGQLKPFEPFFIRSQNFEWFPTCPIRYEGVCRDKVYCTLTGQLMALNLEAVQKHISGKKFKKAKGTAFTVFIPDVTFLEAFMEGRLDLKPEPDLNEFLESEPEGDDAMEIDSPAPKRKLR